MILYYSKIKMMSKYVFEKNGNVHKNIIEITILEGWEESDFFPVFQVFYMEAGTCLKDSVKNLRSHPVCQPTSEPATVPQFRRR